MAEPAGTGEGIDHVAVIAAEGAALIASMREGEWHRPVPAIPEWDRLALAGHVGKVWGWAATIVSQRLTDFPGFDPEPVITPDTAITHLEAGLVALMDALRGCPEDAALWTFHGPGTLSFWKRRQAVETLIHRVDSQTALGTPTPIDPEVAADGVGEFVTVVLPLQALFKGNPAGAFTARTTDTGQSWTCGDPAGGSGELSGPAQELLLGLWKRGPLDELRHESEPAVVAGWLELGTL